MRGAAAAGGHAVPRWNQITSGTAVSIILKEDQPTGRQVQGTVQQILTKGDHPRGVKVRLSDGRVGRVQRLVVAGGASPGITTLEVHSNQPASSLDENQSQQRFKYRDIRRDGELEEPPTTNDLSAYIKPARTKKNKRGKVDSGNESLQQSLAEVSCPVCGNFTGDEAAVAHHVQSHFD